MATQPQLAVDRVIPWINPYEYILNTNQGDFVYVPKDIVNKGYVAERYEFSGSGADLRQTKEKRQYFHPEFLNQDFLGQAKAVNLDQGVFSDEQKKALSSSVGGDITNGYLFPAVKYIETVKPAQMYSITEGTPAISGIKTISTPSRPSSIASTKTARPAAPPSPSCPINRSTPPGRSRRPSSSSTLPSQPRSPHDSRPRSPSRSGSMNVASGQNPTGRPGR